MNTNSEELALIASGQEVIESVDESEYIQDMSSLNDLHRFLAEYAGDKYLSKDDVIVDVSMILMAIREEFPELLDELAEKNYFAGYRQAMGDSACVLSEDNEDVVKSIASYRMMQSNMYWEEVENKSDN